LFSSRGVPAGRTLNIVVGGLFANMAGNHTFLRENILMNDNVLQNAHDFKVGCGSTAPFSDRT
jgi:GDP-L-fucose synthase